MFSVFPMWRLVSVWGGFRLCFATLMGLLWACPGKAQTGDDYDRELAAAVKAHGEQRWLDARSHFELAHALRPSARTLRGMGTSAYEAKLFALAVRDLRAALVHAERPLTPELRSAVEALLVEGATPQIGVYSFRVQPAAASLTVTGGTAVTGAQGELLLDRGDYYVVAAMPGYVSQEVELHVHGGEREEIRLVLASVPAPHEVARSVLTPSAPTMSELAKGPRRDLTVRKEQHAWMRPVAYGSTGLAALSFGLSGVLYGVAKSRIRDIGDECRTTEAMVCTLEQAQAKERDKDVPRLEHGMTATIAVGAASALVAAALWALDLRARR